MRTIWNGSISFGLVNIPVGLAPATTPKAKQSDVSFRQLHRECKTPIQQKRWCPTHEREVGPDEIVKGWEVASGYPALIRLASRRPEPGSKKMRLPTSATDLRHEHPADPSIPRSASLGASRPSGAAPSRWSFA